jgi:flagellar L-ring protein precursor FlgH
MDTMHTDTETQTLSRDELVSRACTALWICLAAAVAVLALSTLAFAQAPAAGGTATTVTVPSDVYDTLYAKYLDSARREPAATNGASIDWMVGLGADPRARHLNDLVTIRVVESINAAGTADAQLNKNSAASASVSQLFGVEKKLPSMVDPTNLVTAGADTKFKGGGVTTRTGELTAILTATIVEVLPNGYLVLEGAREIEINGDRQMVVLTGVVRPVDIGKDNVVLSPSIGQLRIRYFGRGLIKDNLKPGWLIRALNKIF